jgi:hypothetical protein
VLGALITGAAVGTFLAFFVGSQVLVAYGTSPGALRLKGGTRRWAMRGVSVVMVVGAGLAWLAGTGNFQKLVQTQGAVQERLP